MNEVNKLSFKEKLKLKLAGTRNQLSKNLAGLFGGGKIDQSTYSQLEELLLKADVGVSTCAYLLQQLQANASLKDLKDVKQLYSLLQELMNNLLQPLSKPLLLDKKPFVVMVVGVNGAGKTTTIGKVVSFYQDQGKEVMLAAGDTFRAAAVEQLQSWAQGNRVIKGGADMASVCHDAVKSAVASKADLLLIDTAGRLPTQAPLIEELKKAYRVIEKNLSRPADEVLLVLDASIGQNTLSQIEIFNQAVKLTGLVLTKLDTTAKGGILYAIAKNYPQLPVRFLGIGEKSSDLQEFNASEFTSALFE